MSFVFFVSGGGFPWGDDADEGLVVVGGLFMARSHDQGILGGVLGSLGGGIAVEAQKSDFVQPCSAVIVDEGTGNNGMESFEAFDG